MVRRAPLLVVLALVATAVAEETPKAKLKRAGELLRGNTEDTVRSGAELCLELNNVAAMELLLDVLNGDQPHYRDIAWETLPDFTDPYARQRVELELKQNKKDDRVRQWCAQALGRFGDAGFGPTLERTLAENMPYVRTAGIEAIGLVGHKPAFAKIEPLATSKEPHERAVAIEALCRLDAATMAHRFESALADLDGGVRCYLLGCAPALYPDACEALSTRFVADADWRPRMQAVENLCAIKTKTAIDALLPATADPRSVIAKHATAYLQRVTGMKFTMKPEWESWWTANREAFVFPEGDKPAPTLESETRAQFNGMIVDSNYVAFVMDHSPDMRAKSSTGQTKQVRAAKELDETLSRLQGEAFTFNVYTYGGPLRAYEKQPVALDKKTQKKALEFIDKEPLTSGKDIWGAIEQVVSDPQLDTVYLLSSGQPEVGLYVHWNRICEHLKHLNRFHKVTIHCVAYSDSKWYREQLENIALSTGGQYKSCP